MPKHSKAIADIDCSIFICMFSKSTMRTGKRMATTYTTQSATGAVLARVAWVYLGNRHPMLLRLTSDTFSDESMLPEGEATTQSSTTYLTLLWFGHMQVFKHEDCILRGKLNKLFSCLLSERAGTIALLA